MNRKTKCVCFISIMLLSACGNRENMTLSPQKDNDSEKWGYVDENGKKRISFRYDSVGNFSEGLAKVGKYPDMYIKNVYKYGYINKKGKEVIPLKYDETEDFSDGLAKVAIGGGATYKYGFIDKTGNEVVSLEYDEAGNFSEGLAWVRKGSVFDGKYGYIDKSGNEVIALCYDAAENFSEGLAKVGSKVIDSELRFLNNKKYGFIDKTGREILPIEFMSIENFSEGLASVCIDNKWGYIDKTGKIVIPPKYSYASNFSEGFALVKRNFGSGSLYIDKTGTIEYSSPPMKVIWDKVLISNLTQINDYRLKLNKSSNNTASFNITSPYLYVLVTGKECSDIFLIDYSEYDIDMLNFKNYSEGEFIKAFEDIYTLIIEYRYADYTQTYKYINGNATETATSYGSFLIYFDIKNKDIVGFDNLRGNKLPETINYLGVFDGNLTKDRIKEQIKIRVKFPK